MEFIAGGNREIIPGPDATVDDDHLRHTRAAMEFFQNNAEAVVRFRQRAEELGRSGVDTVIALINVDDEIGGVLADALMPGHNWQAYRDAGQEPIAQGLALKDGIPEFLESYGHMNSGALLRDSSDLKVLVVDSGVSLLIDSDFEIPS